MESPLHQGGGATAATAPFPVHTLLTPRTRDGKTLATTGDDRTVRLWDLRTHRQLALLAGHTGVLRSALFAPDGNTLTTSSDDETVRLWDTNAFNDLATLTDNACAIAGRPLSEQEWHRYVPNGVAYHRICP
ncbi:hypothetical protein ABZ353_26440 [Streptomyces niveus]|uniref:WD40 repeat domain-containing protein n=1 Tax=Streptomyces niveus TaxID=193462 RepID=UPI0033FC74E5